MNSKTAELTEQKRLLAERIAEREKRREEQEKRYEEQMRLIEEQALMDQLELELLDKKEKEQNDYIKKKLKKENFAKKRE